MLMLCLVCSLLMRAQTWPLTVATMNVDGLPPELSALGLNISINPEGPQEEYTKVIAEKMMEHGWDIIGLNEDFNYHDVLTQNISGYQVMTHGGKFEASTTAAVQILRRKWRFKTDGLGLLVKKPMNAYNEDIHAWNDCYGYLDHDNDSLTLKGFRRYDVDVAEDVTISVIVLHADAYDAKPDRMAREKQMDQLMDYVEQNVGTARPLIIMGDFNQRYGTERLKEQVLDRLNNNKSIDARDAWMEYAKDHPGVPEMIDKIIYVNTQKSAYRLELKEFVNGFDFLREDGTALSDHYPASAAFEVIDKEATGITETTTPQDKPRKRIVNGRLIIEKGNARYTATGTPVL